MAKDNFRMSDVQHREWFITDLVPHIHMLLMQQNIASHPEALEIIMKLEASLVGKTGIGMSEI